MGNVKQLNELIDILLLLEGQITKQAEEKEESTFEGYESTTPFKQAELSPSISPSMPESFDTSSFESVTLGAPKPVLKERKGEVATFEQVQAIKPPVPAPEFELPEFGVPAPPPMPARTAQRGSAEKIFQLYKQAIDIVNALVVEQQKFKNNKAKLAELKQKEAVTQTKADRLYKQYIEMTGG